ncbi:MAG: phosphate acyltransferase [bacterium]|nr:phosphate acyltransferase [bacterium]
MNQFEEIRQNAAEITRQNGPAKLAVGCANDPATIKAIHQAANQKLIHPVLFGMEPEIRAAAEKAELNLNNIEIVAAKSKPEALAQAITAVKEGRANLLMRGCIDGYQFIRAVTSEKSGMRRTQPIWSHVGLYWPKSYQRFIMVSDGWINVDPDLDTITKIITNALTVSLPLGIAPARVAILAAVETVYPNVPVTIGGAAIAKMSDRGQIKGALVDGPLSFDVALIPEAARDKKVGGEVAGNADILIANKVEVAHNLGKALFLFCDCASAGLLIGAENPVIMTSRSESAAAKFNSIALAVMMMKKPPSERADSNDRLYQTNQSI